MEKKIFSVSGMKCVNCKANVEKALKALPGVTSASVSLENANVTVEYDNIVVSPEKMKETIDNLGRFEMAI